MPHWANEALLLVAHMLVVGVFAELVWAQVIWLP